MGYRRLPNLKDLLTSSTISYPPNPKPDTIKSVHIPVCTGLGKCTYCPKLRKVDQITSFHSKQVFKCKSLPPKHKVTFELSNVIYIINYNKCGLQYVGETKRPIRNRMYEHYNSVCMKICPLMAPPTQVPPYPLYKKKKLPEESPKASIINYNKCGLQYVGETKRPIRNRMYEHYNSVCMKICPLMAPPTQVPPYPLYKKKKLPEESPKASKEESQQINL